MNTNINNKKFKLVPLRNQSMQAFACKRECDKEASGDDGDGEGGRKRGQREGLVMWRPLGGGFGGEKKIMTTPRLIRFRFNDTQKPMDVISDFVVIINPHVYCFLFFFLFFPDYFPFIPWLHPFTFIRISSRFRHDSGMPPQSQKKKCHTTDSSLMIYVHMYIHMSIHWQTLSIKNTFRVLFLFFVSHVLVHRECGMKIGKRQRKSVLEK